MNLQSHHYNEISKLTELIYLTERQNILEIGAYLFELTAFFLAMARKIVISVDKKNHNEKRLKLLQDLYPKNFRFVQGDSTEQETIDKVKKHLGRTFFDIIFIDGNHTYNGVELDTKNYSFLVKPNGFVVWHDASKRIWEYIYYLKEEKNIPIQVFHEHPLYEKTRGLAYICGFKWLKHKKAFDND